MAPRLTAIFLQILTAMLVFPPPALAEGKDLSSPSERSPYNLFSLISQIDEKILWLLLGLMAFFVFDLLVVLLQRRKSEKALKETMDQFNLLLDSAAEGIYGLDLDGRCTFCNPACLKLLGYKDESELLGKNLHELIHHTRVDGSPYPASDCKICHAYQHNSKVHLEDECLWRADGTSFPVEYWSYPLIKGNKTVGAVVSFLDISDRKLAEQKLVAANKEMDTFVYTVSHDLRTPISAVVGYADLIKEMCGEDLPAEGMELLDTIEKQGEKMALIVEDLLALATAGNIDPPPEPINVNDVFDYVTSELAMEIESAKARIVSTDLPPVQIPESSLIQLFENLLGNALRYANAENAEIEVGGKREGVRSSYYVRDHGQGIPAAERDKIFDVFYRGTTGESRAGSGVGLATVRKICELYDGSVSVEETPGGGATFRFQLTDADHVSA